MRRLLALSVACGGIAWASAAASAAAAHPMLESTLRTSGDVTVTWHGDTARGCAAMGLCDVSGALTFVPAPTASFDFQRAGAGLSPVGSSGSGFAGAVVRVRRDGAGGPGSCSEALDLEDAGPELFPAAGGALQLSLGGFQRGLSSGRCAGPTAADLADVLPVAPVDAARLLARGARLDLSGRRPLVAGPFSGEVVSSLVAVLSPLRRRGSGGVRRIRVSQRPRNGGRRLRVATRSVTYRILPVSGTSTSPFAGAPAPGCEPFDACATTGTTTYALRSTGGTLVVTRVHVFGGAAARRLARRLGMSVSADGAGAAVFATLRGGTLGVSESVRPGGGTECRDDAPGELPSLDAALAGGEVRLTLGEYYAQSGGGPLRTHCPGPELGDVLGDAPLASGALSLRSVGGRSLVVGLRDSARFSAGGYTGTRSASFDLRLRRTRVSHSTRTLVVG
jgi:hypothetical protein